MRALIIILNAPRERLVRLAHAHGIAGLADLPEVRDALADEAYLGLLDRLASGDLGAIQPIARHEATRRLLACPEVRKLTRRLTLAQLEQRRAELGDLQLVDVRQPAEQAAGMLDGAVSMPLTQLRDRAGELDFAAPIVVYCAGGYRSSVAASYLRAAGAADVSDLLGGYGACTVRPAGAGTGTPG